MKGNMKGKKNDVRGIMHPKTELEAQDMALVEK